MINCPHCNATGATRHGYTGDGRQRMLCQSPGCGRIFVSMTLRPRVSQTAKEIAGELAAQLGQPLTAAILAKATGLSERTIYALKAKQGAAGV